MNRARRTTMFTLVVLSVVMLFDHPAKGQRPFFDRTHMLRRSLAKRETIGSFFHRTMKATTKAIR